MTETDSFLTPNDINLSKKFDLYLNAFEVLNTENLSVDLIPKFDENAEFKDPFNHVFNRKEIEHIFFDMFDQLIEPKFTIIERCFNAPSGMVYWKFQFQTAEHKERQTILGMSRIELNAKGEIKKHIDYWDPAENIYVNIPILGWILNKIKQKLSSS